MMIREDYVSPREQTTRYLVRNHPELLAEAREMGPEREALLYASFEKAALEEAREGRPLSWASTKPGVNLKDGRSIGKR